MEEKRVKEYFEPHLKSTLKSDYYIAEFTLPTSGKTIDFISFFWGGGYEIQIEDFECKGTSSEYTIAKMLQREQIKDYQKEVPIVYLVANSKNHEDIAKLYSYNGVSWINIDDKGIPKMVSPTEKSTATSWLNLNKAAFKKLRAISVMYLSFRELFGDDFDFGSGKKAVY